MSEDKIVLCDANKLQKEIEKNLMDHIEKRLKDIEARVDAWTDAETKKREVQEGSFERHAMQVESFLGSIEKVLKAKL